MAFEVPISLIRQVQIGLRKEAGVASYDPEDPSLLDLPSLEEAIAGFDPSPPYLRCKQCRGRLLRGLQSMVCVYCGAQQRRDIPPDAISFKSTFGYRWLLGSLDLNGSEAIGSAVDSTKGQNSSKDVSVLSDLFDFELKWPAESEKIESGIGNMALHQSRSSMNLAGVDLDNFFSEGKIESAPSLSSEQLIPNKQIRTSESHAFSNQENLSLFENAESSNVSVRFVTTDGAVGDLSSGWEAEFQSASSGTLPGESKSFNNFLGSSPIDHSGSVEASSDPDTDIKFKINTVDNTVKAKSEPLPPSSVNNNSWIQDDQWHDSNTSISHRTEQIEMNRKTNNDEPKDRSNNIMSMNDNWIQDDLWPNDNTKASKGSQVSADDSFDAWQEFTSTGKAPGLSSSSWKQTDTTASSDALASEKNLVNLNKNLQEVSFGSFTQSDLFSGTSGLHNGSYVSNTQEASIADRGVEVKTDEEDKSTTDPVEIPHTVMQAESADSTVDMLMSQMHDLSFMLDSNLSIPKKEGFDSVSWD